jgi:hypothetical protein
LSKTQDFIRGQRYERDLICMEINSLDCYKLDDKNELVPMTPGEMKRKIYGMILQRG